MPKYPWKDFWPLAIWPGALWVLNPDVVIIPALKGAGVRFELVTPIAVVAGLVDLLYTMWCWAKISRRLVEVKEVRELRRRLSIDGWLDHRIIDLLINLYHQAVDPNGWLEGKLKKVGGRRMLYLLCASPLPGPRTPTAIYCAVKGAHARCLGVLVLCDMIHVIGVSFIWEFVFWILRHIMNLF